MPDMAGMMGGGGMPDMSSMMGGMGAGGMGGMAGMMGGMGGMPGMKGGGGKNASGRPINIPGVGDPTPGTYTDRLAAKAQKKQDMMQKALKSLSNDGRSKKKKVGSDGTEEESDDTE